MKGQVPKAVDVNKSISYERETEAQEGEGSFLDPQVLLGPSCEVASCCPGGLTAWPQVWEKEFPTSSFASLPAEHPPTPP